MNRELITIFTQLKDLANNEKADSASSFRVKSYNKVIKYLESYPTQIKTINDINIFSNTHDGIGKKTIDRMIEFINTGTLKELNEIQHSNNPIHQHMKHFNIDASSAEQLIKAGYTDPTKVPPIVLEYINVTNMFKEIYGVGPVNADKWFYEGYRTLSDIPQESLTYAQQIGIKYYNDFKQRIPRNEIDKLNNYLNQINGLTFMICGSYRRGLPDSGDIDIVVLDVPNTSLIEYLITLPFMREILAKGTKKINGVALIDKVHRRIDFEIVQKEEYPYAILYFTGPKEFNIALRDRARKMGWRLNEKGLILANGESFNLSSEKEIMETLGFPYYTPEEREKLI